MKHSSIFTVGLKSVHNMLHVMQGHISLLEKRLSQAFEDNLLQRLKSKVPIHMLFTKLSIQKVCCACCTYTVYVYISSLYVYFLCIVSSHAYIAKLYSGATNHVLESLTWLLQSHVSKSSSTLSCDLLCSVQTQITSLGAQAGNHCIG